MPFDANGNWVDVPNDPFPGVGGGDPSGGIFGPSTMGGDWGMGGGPDPGGGGAVGLPSGWEQIGTGLSDLWKSLTSGRDSIGQTAMRTAPGLLALDYARGQPGFDATNLESILGRLGGNQDAIVRAATDPFQQNIAAGYGDLVQSQGLRGIRGSSFGDTDIANYMDITGRGLANAGASAAQGSLALQGDLASRIAQFKQQQQQIKNLMYGRAFDVLGRGLNPGGYASTINMGGGGGSGGGGGNDLSTIGSVVGIAQGIGSLFSDRSLKSNIVKVGEDPRGWGIYEFDTWAGRSRGVMADEVEPIVPEAVSIVGGLKRVDYARLYP